MSEIPKYSQEVQSIVASIDEEEMETQNTEPLAGDEEEPEEVIHIHHYPNAIVIEKETITKPHVIESEPAAKEPIKPQAPGIVFFFALFLALLVPLSCLAFELYLASIQPLATVTILSTETTVTAHTSISVPAHQFTPLTFSQSQTIPTTGSTHQNATQATGYVTFYNSLTQAQDIPAGTLLIGADNEQVTTNTNAYVPAGNLQTNGHVTVSATAINYGEEGNIRPGDIFGPCCRAFIQVINGQFSGGQNERNYQSVAKADIQNVVNNLSQQFQQTLQEKTASLVASSETLLTPIPCTSNVLSDHTAGAEATQVMVTLRETCTPEAYITSDFQKQVNTVLAQAATQKLGTGYSLLGNVETSIEKTTLQKTSLLFTVTCNGTWAYAFNLHQLATLIKGKSQQEAKALLQKQDAVTHISMQVSGTKNDMIPTDTAQIHFLIFYEPV